MSERAAQLHLDGSAPRSLPSALTRPFLHHIVGLFFRYLYPLTPCVLRPSFLRDLLSKRYERRGEHEWTTLLLSVVASTLVQLPWAFSSLSKTGIRTLATECYTKVKEWLFTDCVQPTVWRCELHRVSAHSVLCIGKALNHHYCTAVTTYLTSIVASHLGFKGTSDQLTGANWGIIFGLRMHDESVSLESIGMLPRTSYVLILGRATWASMWWRSRSADEHIGWRMVPTSHTSRYTTHRPSPFGSPTRTLCFLL